MFPFFRKLHKQLQNCHFGMHEIVVLLGHTVDLIAKISLESNVLKIYVLKIVL